MLHRLFQHIREQPRSTRDAYASTAAIALTGVVALGWVFSGPGFLTFLDDSDTVLPLAAETDTARDQGSTPFASFMRQARQQLASPSGAPPASVDEPEVTSAPPVMATSSESAETDPMTTESVNQPHSAVDSPRTVLIATTSAATTSPDTE